MEQGGPREGQGAGGVLFFLFGAENLPNVCVCLCVCERVCSIVFAFNFIF